jgi:ABC-type multidrug transport system ATPase subunit
VTEVPALRLAGVTVRRGGRDVLVDVTATLPSGLTVLTGGNGSGKSTLLAAIAGIVPYVRGEIAILGADLVRAPVAARRNLGLLPERADAFVGLSPRAWLGFVAGIRDVPPAPSLEEIGALIDDASAVDRPMSTLSAGQRRKVALVAALCGEPPLLLLDEPQNALDEAGIAALEAAVERWCASGRAVLCAMHRPGAWLQRARSHWHVEDRGIRVVA